MREKDLAAVAEVVGYLAEAEAGETWGSEWQLHKHPDQDQDWTEDEQQM